MASLIDVATGDDAVAEHVQQIIELLKGLRNIPIAVTGINDAASYAMMLKNIGTGGKALLVLSAAGATLLDVSGSTVTLTTPTIADYTNGAHNHSNAAGGGAIVGALGIVTAPATDPPAANQVVAGSLLKARANVAADQTLGGDFNISGITDNGTGDFTLAFDTDFNNTTYTSGTSATGGSVEPITTGGYPLAGANRYQTLDYDGVAADIPSQILVGGVQ